MKYMNTLIIILVVAVIGVFSFIGYLYFQNNRLSEAQPTRIDTQNRIYEFEGEIACLELQSNSQYGQEQEECALGLKAVGGLYYSLGGFEGLSPVEPTMGQKVRLSGKVENNVNSIYQISGRIIVTKYEEILEYSPDPP